MLLLSLILSHFLVLSYCNSIKITWSTPENVSNPPTENETLLAILTHLQVLHLASFVPRILSLNNKFNIKLCPPQPFDPLVKEFTVPRLSGYSLLYDHECIQKAQQGMTVKWGSKPKQPAPDNPTQNPLPLHGTKGFSVIEFIHEIYKTKNSKNELDNSQIWLVDSDSVRTWFTAPTLYYLSKTSKSKNIIPPAVLMRQINSMYGSIGGKDLINTPQAIQGALLVVLPDYSKWNKEFSPKHILNPTWWITRNVPREKSQIISLLENVINKSRISDQLIIIHHYPTQFNLDIVSSLSSTYGKTYLISSTHVLPDPNHVLPKPFTMLQLLQFIQKAAVLAVDSRDLLGQISLLSTGHSDRVHLIQNHLKYTKFELIIFISLTIWVVGVFVALMYYTRKHYDDPLDIHLVKIALSSIYAVAPVIFLTPSMWPKFIFMGIYSVLEAGYEVVLYGIIAFYSIAGFLTVILVIYEKYKNRNIELESSVTNENDSSVDSDSINLIRK